MFLRSDSEELKGLSYEEKMDRVIRSIAVAFDDQNNDEDELEDE